MPNSFTISYPRITSKIITDVGIYDTFSDDTRSVAWNPQYKALWDTGATKTCVSKKLARELNLQKIGLEFVHSASGLSEIPSPIFHVGITLPNRIFIKELKVILTDLPDGFDVLIGMDIINRGDMAISNNGGKTHFTFRTPSSQKIDFVSSKKMKISRNAACPCKSGKKYKQCCAKDDRLGNSKSEKR